MIANRLGSWIGASLLRKEDARYLHGRGMFIADVDMPDVQDITFVRSQMANANIRQVIKPRDRQGGSSHWPKSAPSTFSRRDRNSPLIATARIPLWPIAAFATSDRR